MKNRKVFLGNRNEERLLVALELEIEEKRIKMAVYPTASLTEDFVQVMNKWEEGEDPENLPEAEVSYISTDEEHILPEDLLIDQPEILKRIRNEWTLKLLSVKLYESFIKQITDLEASVNEAGGYTQEFWDKAKEFWDKVGEHAKDFNLSRQHTGQLRDKLNEVFGALKAKRETGQAEFVKASEQVRTRFEQVLSDLKEKVDEQSKSNELFSRLKGIQQEIKDAKLTHKDRRGLWKNLDEAFSKVKSQREAVWRGHLDNRIKGLEKAMSKMKESIKRDQSSLDFQSRKLNNSGVSQLEHQLRSTKLKVIADRMKSKQEKYNEMHRTLEQLRSKSEKEKAKQEERYKKAAAKGPEEGVADLLDDAAKPSAAKHEVKDEVSLDQQDIIMSKYLGGDDSEKKAEPQQPIAGKDESDPEAKA
jgi:chromosome segregation ATPase